MLEQYVRPQYQQWLVNPLSVKLKNLVAPNNITLLSGVLGVLVVPALIYDQIFLAIVLLLASGFCDTLDGTLARYAERTSAFGSVLDITVDRCVEFAVVLGLWMVDPIHRSLLCLLMLGSILLCVTSFLVVGIFTPNASEKGFHYSPGIMERAEAFIFFILMMLLPAYFTLLATLFTILVLMTAMIRLYEFKQQSK